MYPRPLANAGNQNFPFPFLPDTAVDYTCAANFMPNGEQSFMCNSSDGSFTPLIPPSCSEGKYLMFTNIELVFSLFKFSVGSKYSYVLHVFFAVVFLKFYITNFIFKLFHN